MYNPIVVCKLDLGSISNIALNCPTQNIVQLKTATLHEPHSKGIAQPRRILIGSTAVLNYVMFIISVVL